VLTLAEVDCFYGSVHALKRVSFALAAGEILGLLGRNGAGKSTTLKAIMGIVKPRSGSIRLDGMELTALPAHAVVKQGVAYVPQGRRLFGELSVIENLTLGLLAGGSPPATLDGVLDLFPALRPRLAQRAAILSGGEQQMVATARALCVNPRVLLLDEPSEGLMPSLVEKLLDTVRDLKARGVGVLLVEQKVDAVLRVADRVVLLENGAFVREATPAELSADPRLLARHVGVGAIPSGTR
jgi:branched-chain amino acid transport system ATP-binding protein